MLKKAHDHQRVMGYSAEWIFELPGSAGGAAVELLPYGAVYFDNCVATLAAGQSVNAGSGELISMVNEVFIELSSRQ